MSKKVNMYEFIDKLEKYLLKRHRANLWVYARNSSIGSLLVKDKVNEKVAVFKSSDSINPIGGSRIEKYINRTKKFKGHNVDRYFYVANDFKENAKRLVKVNKQLTLISYNDEKQEITINGAMNIDINLLNILIEFSTYLKVAISYDFVGLLKHQRFDSNKTQPITQIEEREKAPLVFFSYSWDSEEHKLWVLKLAAELLKNGIDVIIDEWDLDKYKNDLHLFMESGIRDADKVIMICTPTYAIKANERKGGVGIENTIITGEFYDESKAIKYIPIARSYSKRLTECLPSYVKTRYTIDFKDNEKYKNSFDELIRKILNVPKFKKPDLGQMPMLPVITI